MESGEYRVFGPPGTGKTHYLTRQIARAVETTLPQKIAVVSFTKAAAEEIASRVDVCNPGRSPDDKTGVRVGTLHSFCYHALEAGEIADTPKWIKEWNRKVAGLPRLKLDGDSSDPMGKDLCRELQETFYLRAKMVPQEKWKAYHRKAFDLWSEWKDERDLKDFTDLIEDCFNDVDVMPGEPEIGFFDEVQDFSALELALVRKWGAHMRQIVLAGDDDQSIYGFKGASAQAFLTPDVSADRKLFLRKSYRLPSEIKKYADRWISRVKEREIKHYDPMKEGGRVVYRGGFSWKSPSPVLACLLEEVGFRDNTVMILASCRYMLDPICHSMSARGMVFHNPYRRSDKGWNPIDPHKGAAKRVLSFLRPDGDTWESPRMWNWGELNDWVEVLDTKKVKFSRGMKSKIKRNAKDEATCGVVITKDELNDVFEGDPWCVPDFMADVQAGDIGWFREHIVRRHLTKSMRLALRVVDRTGSGAELKREPKVIVGTIHSIKGGQCDTAILFPDLSGVGYNQLARDPDSVTRLFYVGLTRARERVVLCGPETQQHIMWI